MKTLVFDAGPIISLALNGLLHAFKELGDQFEGEFAIPHQVRKELVDRPFKKRRFQFEALQVLELIRKKQLKVYNLQSVRELSSELLTLANSIYEAHDNPIQIVHGGEIQAIGLALHLNADALVIDERTTRYLLEKPQALHRRLESKLHTHVVTKRDKLTKFRSRTKQLKVLRSTELIAVAYELGLMDRYEPQMKNSKKILIDSLLWALKMRGCAISDDELFALAKLEDEFKGKH